MRKILYIFSTLTDDDVLWLVRAGQTVTQRAGVELVAHGARVHDLWFVLDGELSVRSSGGAELARLATGEIVGEMSLVDPAPTTVSVHVHRAAKLLQVPTAALRHRLDTDPPFAARMYRAMCTFLASRMRSTSARFGAPSAPNAAEALDAADELNDDLLDNVHLAGSRFDLLVKRAGG